MKLTELLCVTISIGLIAAFLLPAAVPFNQLRAWLGDEGGGLALTSKNGKLHADREGSTLVLPMLSAQEFPSWPT